MSLAPQWSMKNAFQCSEGIDQLNEQFTRAIGLQELSTAIFAYLVYKEGRLGAGMVAALTIGIAEITIMKQSKEGGLMASESFYNAAYAVSFTLLALTLAGQEHLANVWLKKYVPIFVSLWGLKAFIETRCAGLLCRLSRNCLLSFFPRKQRR